MDTDTDTDTDINTAIPYVEDAANVAIPGSGEVLNVLQKVFGLASGATPHNTYDNVNTIVHTLIDSVISGILAQIPDQENQQTIACMAVCYFNKFTYIYQTQVSNLAGVRVTWRSDNLKDAYTGKIIPPDVSGNPKKLPYDGWVYTASLAAITEPRMLEQSIWRLGMLVFTNMDNTGNDKTVPSRILTLYNALIDVVNQFNTLTNANIDPGLTQNQTTSAAPITQAAKAAGLGGGGAVPVAGSPTVAPTVVSNDSSILIIFGVIAIAVGIYFVNQK